MVEPGLEQATDSFKKSIYEEVKRNPRCNLRDAWQGPVEEETDDQ